MGDLLLRQKALIQVAAEQQLANDQYHIATQQAGYTEFPVNSYVLLKHPNGNRMKHQSPLQGPYRVVNIVGTKYTIQDLVLDKNLDTHITNLRPFLHDSTITDPVKVAVQNKEEFHIDHIMAHRGDRYSRTSMEYKVRWLGYDETYDSWEPYKNLRDTDQLISYLHANRMKTLINTKHR